MKNDFINEYFLPLLKTYNEDMKKEGLIPTLDLLIEKLEGQEQDLIDLQEQETKDKDDNYNN